MNGKEIAYWFEVEHKRKIGMKETQPIDTEITTMGTEKFREPNWRLVMILYSFIFFMVVLMCGSCTTIRYVPVESETSIRDSVRVRDSINYIERINQKDSVVLRDSIVQVVDDKGNVIRTELYRYKEVNKHLESEVDRLKMLLEQKSAEKKDSIMVPYPVEKPLTHWQKLKLDIGGMAMLGLVLIIICNGWIAIHKRKS